MSAFFIAINRDQTTFDPQIARDMMGQLAVYGNDQAWLSIRDNFALGYQSLWTVAEEVGEVQPLHFAKQDIWFMFDGRVDNRSALIQLLALNTELKLSDAELVYRFYQHFGQSSLKEVIGPFVFVIFNVKEGSVFAARDGMGGRNLVFRVCEKYILIATYEMALVGHPSVAYRFNHARIARVIARLIEDQLSSPIEGLDVLAPGECLNIFDVITRECKRDYFYQFDGSVRTILENDQAYAKQFKALLSQAVERRSRAIGPVGSMLSGGFDSVPMSILLSQKLVNQEKKMTAFSWVFDRHSDVDERQYSSMVCEKFDIQQVCINCDDVWPQFDDTTYLNPVMPFSIPYVELQQAALNEAKHRSIRTVLSGVHGDLLYGYTDSILWELFKQGRWRDLITESGCRLQASLNLSQWFKRYILRPIPWVQRKLEKRRLRTPITSELLTDTVLSKLKHRLSSTSKNSVKSLRPIAYNLVMGGFAGEDIAYGRHIDAFSGIDRRYPFRDRDLCEFMLSIPSDQLFFKGVTRPIVRRAFSEEFPKELLDREGKTSFYPAIQAGIENDENYRQWYAKLDANWQFYVKKCYLNGQDQQSAGVDVICWQCGYYDYWKSVCYDKIVSNLGLSNESEKKGG